MTGIAALPLIVSQFPTAMPKGDALGDMAQKTWGDLRDMLSVRREGQKDGPEPGLCPLQAGSEAVALDSRQSRSCVASKSM